MDNLVETLAGLLNTKWKRTPELKGERKELILKHLADLQSGILLLTTFDKTLRELLQKTAVDKAKEIIDQVESAIVEFQSSSDLLHKDGILGHNTLKLLRDIKSCAGSKDDPDLEITDAAKAHIAGMGDGTWFFYFIESLPHVPGPIPNFSTVLFNNAWAAWALEARIRAQPLRSNEKHLANVIVRKSKLPGNILGQAHVGPPGSFVLEMELDDRPNWTDQLFFNAACHEIGHVLGLHHSPNNTDLMFTHIPSNVNGPTDSDGDRAELIYGPSAFS